MTASYKIHRRALTHGGMANRVQGQIEWVDAEVFDQSGRPVLAPRRVPRDPRARGVWRTGYEGQDQGRTICREPGKSPILGNLSGHADGPSSKPRVTVAGLDDMRAR